MSVPFFSRWIPFTALAVILAALACGGCSGLPLSSPAPPGSPTATPTTCGCVLGTEDFPTPAAPSPSPSASPQLSATRPEPTSTPTPQPSASPPAATATGEDTAQAGAQGQVVSGEVDTTLLKKPLSYLVYLPPGYDSQAARRYPVIYLLHGQGSTDDQWVRLGVNKVADRLIDAREIPPVIVVMPYEENALLPEQTHFGEAVVTALVPWIDANYLTVPDRAERAIGGLSRRASWAVRLGLNYWQTFGAIGAHSFPEFYGDGPMIPKWLATIPPASYPRLYLDIGKSDPGRQLVEDFEAFLTAQGIPHEFHLYSGYHDETYWQAHVEDYLRWYAAEW